MTSLREFFSLPIGSRGPGNDTPVGVDEFGRMVYEATPNGQQYAIREEEPQRFSAIEFARGAANAPGETVKNVARALLEGAVSGVTAPGRALRGEPVTYGDVADTALDWGVLSAAGSAPRGALRSGNWRDYGIDHRPMTVEGGAATLDDLTPAFGEDIYGPNAIQYFGGYDPREAGILRQMQAVRGNPDAPVTIYRGVPDDATGINAGDWVTLNREVAQDYGPRVVEMTVPARDVTSWPDSLLEFGYYPSQAAETPAQSVARLLREGRASEVTDDMMAAVDPQEMARLYETGATGMDMPLDEASRMARAREMGFDTDTPLYHGTNADVPAFDPSRAGQVGADFGPASYTTTSPTTASGYAGQAINNAQWRALGDEHQTALSEWGRAVVQHGPDAPEAVQAQGRAQSILDRMNAIQADVESFRAPSDGGNVVPILADQSGFPRYAGDGGHWYQVNEAAIADARAGGASGLRIENVIDPATTSTREAADTVISFDPTRIRSRFARFDPRLRHLANLSAGIGAGAIMLPQEEREATLAALRNYVERNR